MNEALRNPSLWSYRPAPHLSCAKGYHPYHGRPVLPSHYGRDMCLKDCTRGHPDSITGLCVMGPKAYRILKGMKDVHKRFKKEKITEEDAVSEDMRILLQLWDHHQRVIPSMKISLVSDKREWNDISFKVMLKNVLAAYYSPVPKEKFSENTMYHIYKLFKCNYDFDA